MEIVIGVAVAAVAVLLAAWIARASMARRLAEERTAIIADLAAVKRDNVWLSEQSTRDREALVAMQVLLEKADHRLREAFQSLAADALNSNRAGLPRPCQDVV
jgi:hypothetical protein